MLDGQQYELTAGALSVDDFSLAKHRRIFAAMGTLNQQGTAGVRIRLRILGRLAQEVPGHQAP